MAQNIARALSRFVQDSPIALTLASPGFDDCPLVEVNAAFTRLTGYNAEYAVGRNCRFLQGRETEAGARGVLRDALARRQEAIVPITNYRRDGSRFRNLVFVFPIVDRQGDLLYLLGSQYDITMPKRLVSPLEHGQLLDEAISLSNARLEASDNVRIQVPNELVGAVSNVLSRLP